jgi:acetyl-CoA C-acetyltransferase
VIFASEEKARRIRDNPAWVLATGTISDTYYFGAKDQAFWDNLAILARRVYRIARIGDPRRDIDVFELYDAFSIQEIMEYEAVGLAPKWSGYRLIEEGVTEVDGDLPVNPSGGVLSTNPIGATGLVRVGEAALQVMGEAGDRQVDDVERALAHAWGGAIQFHGMMILGRTPR